MHVLVVEDSKALSSALEMLLSARGHWVKKAANGDEAKAVVVIGPMPDCIVVDYYLPGENGIDFIKFVRGYDGGKAVPIILMSAADDEKLHDLVNSAHELGLVSVLSKPFDHEELLSLINHTAAPKDSGRRRRSND